MHFSFLPCVLHAPPISSSLRLSIIRLLYSTLPFFFKRVASLEGEVDVEAGWLYVAHHLVDMFVRSRHQISHFYVQTVLQNSWILQRKFANGSQIFLRNPRILQTNFSYGSQIVFRNSWILRTKPSNGSQIVLRDSLIVQTKLSDGGLVSNVIHVRKLILPASNTLRTIQL
jgi:hypothetical protein